MGCDTKGFVLTNEKNPFVICSNIEYVLTKKMQELFDGENYWDISRDGKFSYPQFDLKPNLGMITCNFTWKKEKRNLSIHFDSDCDGSNCGYKDGSKIIFSFGMWGSSIELMNIVLDSVSKFGDCYLIENDCGNYEIDECKLTN